MRSTLHPGKRRKNKPAAWLYQSCDFSMTVAWWVTQNLTLTWWCVMLHAGYHNFITIYFLYLYINILYRLCMLQQKLGESSLKCYIISIICITFSRFIACLWWLQVIFFYKVSTHFALVHTFFCIMTVTLCLVYVKTKTTGCKIDIIFHQTKNFNIRIF